MSTARETGAALDEAQALDAVQTGIRAALAAAPWPSALTTVATDVLASPARALGGRLTPWMLSPLGCCAAVCGDWTPALPSAVAAELYVTALDLCDDIEDGDFSVPIDRYGVSVVLNLATALLALAHVVLAPVGETSLSDASRRAQDALWTGLAVATGGQHLDLVAAGADPLPVDDCLDIARRKGGALVEACCRAGAAFATDNGTLIDLLGQFGRSVGLAAQLDNDMHDADDGARKSDVARRKQTVPIAMARAHGEEALNGAVWQGGIQFAYALMHAERVRAGEALRLAAAACPDPALAHTALGSILKPRGPVPPSTTTTF